MGERRAWPVNTPSSLLMSPSPAYCLPPTTYLPTAHHSSSLSSSVSDDVTIFRLSLFSFYIYISLYSFFFSFFMLVPVPGSVNSNCLLPACCYCRYCPRPASSMLAHALSLSLTLLTLQRPPPNKLKTLFKKTTRSLYIITPKNIASIVPSLTFPSETPTHLTIFVTKKF